MARQGSGNGLLNLLFTSRERAKQTQQYHLELAKIEAESGNYRGRGLVEWRKARYEGAAADDGFAPPPQLALVPPPAEPDGYMDEWGNFIEEHPVVAIGGGGLVVYGLVKLLERVM